MKESNINNFDQNQNIGIKQKNRKIKENKRVKLRKEQKDTI
jgi:hypothetical protein